MVWPTRRRNFHSQSSEDDDHHHHDGHHYDDDEETDQRCYRHHKDHHHDQKQQQQQQQQSDSDSEVLSRPARTPQVQQQLLPLQQLRSIPPRSSTSSSSSTSRAQQRRKQLLDRAKRNRNLSGGGRSSGLKITTIIMSVVVLCMVILGIAISSLHTYNDDIMFVTHTAASSLSIFDSLGVVGVGSTTTGSTSTAASGAGGGTTPLSTSPPTLRLHDDDIHVISQFNAGSINYVFECQIVSRTWWDYQYSLPESQRRFSNTTTRFLMKITNDLEYGPREYNAMKAINADPIGAQQVGLLPLIAGASNITNPFVTGDMTFNYMSDGSASDLGKTSRTIRMNKAVKKMMDPVKFPRVVLLIVPDASQQKAGMVFDDHLLDTLPKIRIFIKDMLQQLRHAWRAGVNNVDLSGGRNVYVSKDNYKAILFDWNGWVQPGELLYDGSLNFQLCPPEFWFDEIDGQHPRMTNSTIHAFDVWSVGVMLSRLIYAPSCRWTDRGSYTSSKSRLKHTVLSLGARYYDPTTGTIPHFYVPVGDGTNAKVDLTTFAGLTQDQFSKAYEEVKDDKFTPTLVKMGGKGKEPCRSDSSFPILDSSAVTDDEVDQVVDLLRLMMTLSPLERPNYDQLLAHPFFTNVPSTTTTSG